MGKARTGYPSLKYYLNNLPIPFPAALPTTLLPIRFPTLPLLIALMSPKILASVYKNPLNLFNLFTSYIFSTLSGSSQSQDSDSSSIISQ